MGENSKEAGKQQDGEAPPDPMRMVYMIFFWLGIGTLLPWNMFITVNAYWDAKFKPVNESTNSSHHLHAANPANDMEAEIMEEIESLSDRWPGYCAVASMVPNVTFLILNGIFGHRFKTQVRLLVSLFLVIVLFTFTTVMVKVDTNDWQDTFFYVTLFSVVLININAAIFQGGMLGVAGKFPPAYIGAVFSGQAVGGIFASATNVVVLSMGATATQAAFFCFLASVIFLGTAMAAYLVATKSDFYQYYLGEKVTPIEIPPEDDRLLDSPEPKSPLPVKVNALSVMSEVWPYGLAVLLTFLVTLGCFPTITVKVVSTLAGTGDWPDKFFIPVCCFLLFNIGDYLGRFLAGIIQWPKPGALGSWLTLLFSVLRFVFIPLFLICNIKPDDRSLTSVVFESDTAYIIIMLLFSITNGYLGSICMICGPQVVRPEEAQTAASLMVAMLGIGLGTGAFLSNFFVQLL